MLDSRLRGDWVPLSLEPGPSRARYFPRDMLLLTTTAQDVIFEPVQTCLDRRDPNPCRESTSSPWAWAGTQFGLPSLPCKQPFQDSPTKMLHWAEFGDISRVCFSWHIRDQKLLKQGSSWKSVMSTCQVCGKEFSLLRAPHQWRASGAASVHSSIYTLPLTARPLARNSTSECPRPLMATHTSNFFSNLFLVLYLTVAGVFSLSRVRKLSFLGDLSFSKGKKLSSSMMTSTLDEGLQKVRFNFRMHLSFA